MQLQKRATWSRVLLIIVDLLERFREGEGNSFFESRSCRDGYTVFSLHQYVANYGVDTTFNEIEIKSWIKK